MASKFAKKYSQDFLKMSDRFKEIYMEMLYDIISKKFDDSRVFMDSMGLPEYCESPIEQILWLALNYYSIFISENHLVFEEQAEVEANGNKYRVDFLYSEDYMDNVSNPFYLAIECDGHDFHEKTKEQVERRNKRDMDLKMEGIDILHYSGSQIYKNPLKCAKKICDYIERKIEGKKNV